MMHILNARQMRALEAATMQEQQISPTELMERAAKGAVRFIAKQYDIAKSSFVVFAGPGNNGGDGLAVARLLHRMGAQRVEAYLFNTQGSLSEECRHQAERLQGECPELRFTEVCQQFEAPPLGSRTVIVDALFGIGLSKPLGGGFAALIQFINASGAQVVSLDLPSGLMCEDNTCNSPSAIVRATHTVVMGLPKLVHLLPDAGVYVGQMHLVSIGLAEVVPDGEEVKFHLSEEAELKAMLKPRLPYGHKGNFGTALLVAGKFGMAGAAVLAAKACLRGGAGKVVIHTPASNNDILQTCVPEAVLDIDADTHIFTTPVPLQGYSALGMGPGMGTDKRTALAFIEQISHVHIPLVLDADAINILGLHKGWIQQVPAGTILTPHAGEMKRLGICAADSYSLLLEAINMATSHHFYIVLKGHFTAVCTPEGHVYFNELGNSGMATAGSGDVLTGLILSLLAQGYSTEEACRLGVYLHALAGDYAAEELGEHCVTASDIIAHLPKAFAHLEPVRLAKIERV